MKLDNCESRKSVDKSPKLTKSVAKSPNFNKSNIVYDILAFNQLFNEKKCKYNLRNKNNSRSKNININLILMLLYIAPNLIADNIKRLSGLNIVTVRDCVDILVDNGLVFKTKVLRKTNIPALVGLTGYGLTVAGKEHIYNILEDVRRKSLFLQKRKEK